MKTVEEIQWLRGKNQTRMIKLFKIICAVAVCFLMYGCSLFSKYQSEAQVPSDVYGANVNIGEESIAQISWREFFVDPLLQELIDSALVRNTDLNSARIAIEQSEASLRAARMAYLPSLYFSPTGSIGTFGHSPATKTYNLPLQLSLDLDVTGTITNQKRKSEVFVMQAKIGEEMVMANLISTVAQQYFLLQVLDRQLEILTVTDSLWNASLETEKVLWDNGKTFSTAVNQMESSYLNVKTQIVDTRRNILSVENSICRLLAVSPQRIKRSQWSNTAFLHYPDSTGQAKEQRMFDPRFLNVGVPAQLLEYRPDVRLADYQMAEAFYNTQAARAAFYPGITLTGTAGWTNNAGAIIDPGKILLSAVASLVQPIFARGRLTANLKVAQLMQKDIQQKYVQTVINAGNEVNEALADCQAAREKDAFYRRQVEVLRQAYMGTHELMNNGKANYLEVLTAQESLLSAQLSEARNMYDGAQAVIVLYIALGGATR